MERLALCSKVLYERDIIEKQQEIIELKKRLKEYEPIKIVTTSHEWEKTTELFFKKIKQKIIENVDEHYNDMLYFKSYVFFAHQDVNIFDIISEELSNLTNNKEKSEYISWRCVFGLTAFFESLNNILRTFIFETLEKEEIADIMYSNIKSQLDMYFSEESDFDIDFTDI